jgi:MOSC domain-containing protein YiiM
VIELKGIARRAKKRAIMQEIDQAQVGEAFGVEGDLRGKPGKRQVTVLSLESWRQACEAAGTDLPWTTRRANLLVEGLLFDKNMMGQILAIGDVQLQITKETVPCFRMDEAHPGLQEALRPDWRGGVCCRVLRGGGIRIGETVQLSLPES